ncbi:MAG: hypothetical protein SFV15_18910 [Polyangiaceae bacterium]|nr:hypothetical protein [Polyangiaceae bacterium]
MRPTFSRISAGKSARTRNALIVRAGENAGCAVLLSEDLQAGSVISGLRVKNPFVG